MFDVEYWSLEQAKLGKRSREAAGRARSCVITGGGSGIGAATAKPFAARAPRSPSSTAIADGADAAQELGKARSRSHCDVTDPAQVRAAFDKVGATPSAASTSSSPMPAPPGRAGSASVDDDVLRKSFELNFFAHQTVAQNAVRIMQAQGTGGCLLFNTSKQAVNPGKDFGPYGLPKAATLFLVRQYALDHGKDGIRSNAVNADRIRTGLLTDDMVAARSKARGLSRDRLHGRQSARPRSARPTTWRRPSSICATPTRPRPPSSPSTAATSRRRCADHCLPRHTGEVVPPAPGGRPQSRCAPIQI